VGERVLKRGYFFELSCRGKKMGIALFSAVTITSRLDSNPLTGGFLFRWGMASDSTPFRRTAPTGIHPE
jgi:hypothetical protein